MPRVVRHGTAHAGRRAAPPWNVPEHLLRGQERERPATSNVAKYTG